MPDIQVEVAYATLEKQQLIALTVPEGSSVDSAIKASGILTEFPEINQKPLIVGIFAQICELDRILISGDRVEIYRPLHKDPKEARRQRAKKK